MALTRNPDPRADRLAALAEWYGITIRDTIDDCRDSAEEDLFLHLFHGEDGLEAEPIHRWCAVTRSGEYTYLYPEFDSREEAEERTTEHDGDDIYSEGPEAVVDLDGDAAAWGDLYALRKVTAVFRDEPYRPRPVA